MTTIPRRPVGKTYDTARRQRESWPQLRLLEVLDAPVDSYPRLGIPLTWEQRMANEGFTSDEIASVHTYAGGELVEPSGFPTYAPHDDYDGSAA